MVQPMSSHENIRVYTSTWLPTDSAMATWSLKDTSSLLCNSYLVASAVPRNGYLVVGSFRHLLLHSDYLILSVHKE